LVDCRERFGCPAIDVPEEPEAKSVESVHALIDEVPVLFFCCCPNLSKINHSTRDWRFGQTRLSGANPTIASYNASVVKTYSAVNSMARL
jgi:hypothetical protein